MTNNVSKKLTRIEQIQQAALDRRSVIVPSSICFSNKPLPAAFIINLQGHLICQLLKRGMYMYRPQSKQSSKDQP